MLVAITPAEGDTPAEGEIPAEGDSGSRRLKPAAQIVARLMKHHTAVARASLPVMFVGGLVERPPHGKSYEE